MSLFDVFKKKNTETPNAILKKEGDEISKNNGSSEGYYFENAEELAVYGKLHKGKTVYWLTGNDYIDAYKIGYQLFEKGQYIQAIIAYKNSLKLNPVGISARFEICESFIHLNDLEKAKSVLLDMKDYLYRSEDIARFYRRMGYIQAECRNYRVAEACVLYSIKFQDVDSARSELEYLRTKNHQPIMPNEIEKRLKDFSIPLLKPQNVDKTIVTSLSQAKQKVSTETCPKCGATITHSYYQFYEVNKENQEVKNQLRENRGDGLFNTKCPKCGVSVSIQYPLQYIDTEKKLNIYLMPVGHPAEKEFFDRIEEYNTRPGFITRLVSDVNLLVDKIDVFEANLDDRVVEVCKVLLWNDLCDQKPEFKKAESHCQWFIYSATNKCENAILFGYEMDGKRDTALVALDNDYYQKIEKAFEPIFPLMKQLTFDEINTKWAKKAIDLLMQHRNA